MNNVYGPTKSACTRPGWVSTILICSASIRPRTSFWPSLLGPPNVFAWPRRLWCCPCIIHCSWPKSGPHSICYPVAGWILPPDAAMTPKNTSRSGYHSTTRSRCLKKAWIFFGRLGRRKRKFPTMANGTGLTASTCGPSRIKSRCAPLSPAFHAPPWRWRPKMIGISSTLPLPPP